MSIFGNENGMVGSRVAPDTYTVGEDGFAGLGKPVPFWRRHAGYEHARKMGLDKERAFSVVEGMCNAIARDEPMRALESGYRNLDVTGCYRLLAVLLSAEKPDEDEWTAGYRP